MHKPTSNPATHFLNRIMHIGDLTMGGAGASIIGSSGNNSDTILGLKRSAIAFLHEYKKTEINNTELRQSADQVSGYLQTLQVTNMLSENVMTSLMDELEELLRAAANE